MNNGCWSLPNDLEPPKLIFMAETEGHLQASAIDFANHAEKLSLLPQKPGNQEAQATTAVRAKFITPQDPVIETADGNRLPSVPVAEASKLNKLKDQVKTGQEASNIDSILPDLSPEQSNTTDVPLSDAYPPQRTHPLFPQLPLYGPASLLRNLQCFAFRTSSFFLSLAFLGTIVLGSAFTSIPMMLKHIGLRLTFKNPDARRPFYHEEQNRREMRKSAAREWGRQRRRRRDQSRKVEGKEQEEGPEKEFEPTEGGSDPILCDVGYYARRVGLDMEEYKVQTEDGFIITLWHLYNPLEYTPVSAERRDYMAPHVFTSDAANEPGKEKFWSGQRKYPVLMIHGLLQSSGAYCTNDDDSLAFFLCKSGYDVWLGNNRCGFKPQHHMLRYGDPRMWNWNIRQMGIMDLPALVSRVLAETGFEKLGLICHSQGTTETFVALAKEQRPDLGSKISVFCALAPAVYAGPLIGKAYLKFMRVISPGMFRIIFGIHAFIPIMMTMHQILPAKLYGALGYRVFYFLFDWSDARWDRDLRDRMFQFAPVYVSSESMRWWLGRECFAKHKCILATKDEWMLEDMEDEGHLAQHHGGSTPKGSLPPTTTTTTTTAPSPDDSSADDDLRPSRGHRAWYDSQVPPFALWVAGSDELVDGHRLLRRFERGREPHVRIVHSKIIPEYEHLDVIWAMDSIEKVGKEIREVLWKTVPQGVRDTCRVPRECEKVGAWSNT